MKTKVTIQDVAAKAGVSTATVSRLINGNGFVSAETKEIVQAVIEATGYSPNRRRRTNGASKQSKITSAKLFWSASEEMKFSGSARGLMLGLTEALRKINAHLNVDYIDVANCDPRSLELGNVDGVFLHGSDPSDLLLEQFKGMPVVRLMQKGSKNYGDRVQPNHIHAGLLSARYLVGQGCRQLCCVTSDSFYEYPAARSYGFMGFAKQQRIPCEEMRYREPQMEVLRPSVLQVIAAEVAVDISKLNPRPDGLFVASILGPYLHQELMKIGIIPMKDIQMVAGDTQICEQFPLSPAPVTIRIFSKEIGQQAVELLLQRIANPDMAQMTCLIEPQLQMPAAD